MLLFTQVSVTVPPSTDHRAIQAKRRANHCRPEKRTIDGRGIGVTNRFLTLAYFSDYTKNYLFRDSEAYNVSDGRVRARGIELAANRYW